MTFAGDIPQGALAYLLYANLDRVIDAAAEVGAQAAVAEGSPVLALGVSCNGRRKILKDRTHEEVEAVLEGLPAGAHLVGYYSFGEFSPFEKSGCDLHNETMTLTTLSEAA